MDRGNWHSGPGSYHGQQFSSHHSRGPPGDSFSGHGQGQPVQERSLRSVFVGNIPYEATEEQLREIFAEVGPVISLRLVFDRETGKPKGFGFCEYEDQETAARAMRLLTGRELNGRVLRIDSAASERGRDEPPAPSSASQAPSLHGDMVGPAEAPVAITKAVASLPPEQMFELMKQMKLCIKNSPEDARTMLLENPQLAYALLQAQVVMRLVDPTVAQTLLFSPNEASSSSSIAGPSSMTAPVPAQVPPLDASGRGPPPGPGPLSALSDHRGPQPMDFTNAGPPPHSFGRMGDQQPPMSLDSRAPPMVDPRRDMRPPGPDHRDMRAPGPGMDSRDMRGPQPHNDSRGASFPPAGPPMHHGGPMHGGPGGPAVRGPSGDLPRGPPGRQGGPPGSGESQWRTGPPPREADRFGPPAGGGRAAVSRTPGAPPSDKPPVTADDEEKAQLIMQVLSLTDEQIALLAPEQRQSIMVLKEQILRSRN